MTRKTQLSTVFLALVLLFLSSRHGVQAGEQKGPIEIGSRLLVFVDHRAIEKLDNARLELHHPADQGIVFTFNQPWEGGLSAYVTILRDGDKFRMYYRGGGDLVREYTCMAESKDGIHWSRPNVGLFEFEGSKDNNIIWTGKEKAYSESHNFSPFIDLNPATSPTERYKAVSLDRLREGDKRKNVLMGYISADGIHWKRLRDEPIITEGAFDSHNTAFWDDVQKQYVCYLRAGQQGKKSIARTTSADFLNWSKPELLDFGGTPIEHFYTNGIVPYFRVTELYVGFPMRFIHPNDRKTIGLEQRKTDGFSDAVFMSSHDGLHWDRPFMEAFIRPGLDPKNWGGAHGNNTPAWGIVQTSDTELSIYWSEHYDNYPEKSLIPQVRRGTLRLDGFVSVNAPYSGGEMVTRPLVFKGKELVLNLSTAAQAGVKVEIQDSTGKSFPGFSLNDCIEIWGDEIERVVAWKKGTDLSSLADQTVRLRFTMQDADLYSLRFRP